MTYTIKFYSPDVQQEIMRLPLGLRVRYTALAERMKQVGANLHEPHTKAMGDGLFEMRLKASEGIARVMYCTLVGQKIVMLHSFVKKTDKTPKQDLELAIKRMKEVKNGNI